MGSRTVLSIVAFLLLSACMGPISYPGGRTVYLRSYNFTPQNATFELWFAELENGPKTYHAFVNASAYDSAYGYLKVDNGAYGVHAESTIDDGARSEANATASYGTIQEGEGDRYIVLRLTPNMFTVQQCSTPNCKPPSE